MCLGHAGFRVKALSFCLIASSEMEFSICSATSPICLFTISITSLFYLVSVLCVCLPSSINDNQGSDQIYISVLTLKLLLIKVGEIIECSRKNIRLVSSVHNMMC